MNVNRMLNGLITCALLVRTWYIMHALITCFLPLCRPTRSLLWVSIVSDFECRFTARIHLRTYIASSMEVLSVKISKNAAPLVRCPSLLQNDSITTAQNSFASFLSVICDALRLKMLLTQWVSHQNADTFGIVLTLSVFDATCVNRQLKHWANIW